MLEDKAKFISWKAHGDLLAAQENWRHVQGLLILVSTVPWAEYLTGLLDEYDKYKFFHCGSGAHYPDEYFGEDWRKCLGIKRMAFMEDLAGYQWREESVYEDGLGRNAKNKTALGGLRRR